MIWNESRYTWIKNVLTKAWTFQSDWKPPTNGGSLGGWEPVFHPAEANGVLYVPGAGGTVYKVNRHTGAVAVVADMPAGYESSRLVADGHGFVWGTTPYTVFKVNIGTGDRRTATTGADGAFRFVNLVPGNYRIEIEQAGFKRYSRDQIAVNVDAAVRIDHAIVRGLI